MAGLERIALGSKAAGAMLALALLAAFSGCSFGTTLDYDYLAAQQTVATPVISAASNTSSDPNLALKFTLSCSTQGATIHYTLDGSTPTASSTVYTGPFFTPKNTRVRAIGLMSGRVDSYIGYYG